MFPQQQVQIEKKALFQQEKCGFKPAKSTNFTFEWLLKIV